MLDAGFSRVARYIIKNREPNLLLVHFTVADTMQHAYGPQSEEAYWARSNVDNRLREIWEALQEPPFRDNSTLFVVAEHGFAPVDKSSPTHVILRQEGLITLDVDGGRPGTRVGAIYAVDVAPTIAAILGLELPEASGRVLTEILR